MKKWSGKFLLNYQLFSLDIFQKYLKIKMLFFHKSTPKNLLQLFTRVRFNSEIKAFGQQNRVFKCIDKRCNNCLLYLEGHSFFMSNNMR